MFLPDAGFFKSIAKPEHREKYFLTYRAGRVYLYYRDRDSVPETVHGLKFARNVSNPDIWKVDLESIKGDISLAWVPVSRIMQDAPVQITTLYPELSGTFAEEKDHDDHAGTEVGTGNGAVRAADAGRDPDAGGFAGPDGNGEGAGAPGPGLSQPAPGEAAADGRNHPVTAGLRQGASRGGAIAVRDVPERLQPFLSLSQIAATREGLRGEEGDFFAERMEFLAKTVDAMPVAYETDGQGDQALVHLHYFHRNADWYITEKDGNQDGSGQVQAFGLADLGQGFPEMGYINLQEITRLGAEMDYHFAPRSLLDLKQEKYPELVQDVPGVSDAADNDPVRSTTSFGTTDPIAREMLKRIDASPYTLPYLLGDERLLDVDDVPYAEDAEWAAARVQFADEIDAILNARIRQNVDALGERGWMQPVLHGDLVRGDAVIHQEPELSFDGDMRGLVYRVSLASDAEGLVTRTVHDYLRSSSERFSGELHDIAEQALQESPKSALTSEGLAQRIAPAIAEKDQRSGSAANSGASRPVVEATNSAGSGFGTTDPIAREMLKRIDASPYTLAYLMGQWRMTDDNGWTGGTVEELYAWESAQEEFADEIDAIINARIQQNELAMAEKGWGADTLHGDLTRKPFVGSVIRLEPDLNAMGYMNGLTYQIIQDGKLEQTLRDTLDSSSTELANALHTMAKEANTDAAERAAADLSGDPYPDDPDVPQIIHPAVDPVEHETIRKALNQSIAAGMSLGDLAGGLRALGINAVMSSDDINQFFHMPVPADTMLLADASDRHEDTVPVIQLPGAMAIVAWKADLDAYLALQAAEVLQIAEAEALSAPLEPTEFDEIWMDVPSDVQPTLDPVTGLDPDLMAHLRVEAARVEDDGDISGTFEPVVDHVVSQEPAQNMPEPLQTLATPELQTMWQPVRYEWTDNRIIIDKRHPPFDGSPVLIHTRDGITEAAWEPEIRTYGAEGEEVEGFCWGTSRGDFFELDEIDAWMPAPDTENSSRPAELPSDESAVLVRTEGHGWVEAWHDVQEHVWQALDAKFTIEDAEVLAWQPLPVMTDDMLDALRAQSELEHVDMDPDLIEHLRERASIRDASHPNWSGLSDSVANAQEFVRQHAMRNPEVAEKWAADLRGNPFEYGQALGLESDNIRGIATLMEQSVKRVRHPVIGDLVRFEPHDPDPLKGSVFSGRVIAALDTSGGDVRYHLRAETGPDQGMEGTVYGKNGSFRLIHLIQAYGFERNAPEQVAESANAAVHPKVSRGDYLRYQTDLGREMEGVVLNSTKLGEIETLRLRRIYRWPEGAPSMDGADHITFTAMPALTEHVPGAVKPGADLDAIDPLTDAYKHTMGSDSERGKAEHAVLTMVEIARGALTRPLPLPGEQAKDAISPLSGPATKPLSDPIVIDGKPMETREFLEERFGSDAAFGVRYIDEDAGMEIPADEVSSFEGDMISAFPDGGITNCTNYARYIQKALPVDAVQVVGFSNEENPDCDAVREGWHLSQPAGPGGHDFAIVDHRYLVDPWAKLVAGVRNRIAYDLQDDQDAALVAQTYGSPATWSEIPEDTNRPRSYEWDRSGLEKVSGHRNARRAALQAAALRDAGGVAPRDEAKEASRAERAPDVPTPLEIADKEDNDRAAGAVDASTLLFLLQRDNGVSISDIVRHPDFKRQVFHGNGVVPYRVPEDFASHAYVGEKTRARNNLAAVRLIKALDAAVSEKDNGTVQLSRELQDVLSRFAGWGGLPNMFRGSDDAFKEGWEGLGLALESLLTKQEMAAARRSTLDAHYTEISVVRAMWNGLRDAGLPDAQMVLEHSVGSGLFLGSAPEQVALASRFMACEMDAITAKIAQRLYPDARVQHAPYETFPIMRPDDTSADSMSADRDHGFDLVIGNPPFGDQRVYDAAYPEISDSSPNIHTYFFEKSLRQLRPGGVMAMVVSRYLMDAKSPEYEDWRKRFALRADLKAAVRLPSNAFMKNAGTQVVTDILVFQRREVPLAGQVTDLANDQYPDWVFATDAMVLSEDGRDVSGNKYYAAHPEHLLGEPALARDMYGENRPVLLANRPTEMVAADICRAIGSAGLAFNDAPSADMATGLSSSEEDAAWNNRATAVMDRHKDRSWFVVTAPDGEERLAVREIRTMSGYFWAKVRNDAQDAQVAEDASTDEGKADDASADATAGFRPSEVRRIIGMCHVRDALLDLMGKQVSPLSSAGEIDDAREHLNQVYDGFTKKYGLLRKKLNQRLFRSESSFGALLALEKNYVPAISATVAKKTGQPRREESAEKADVFFKRTQFPVEEPDRAADAMDALRLSLSQKGVVDRTYMAHLLRDDPLLKEKPAAERWPAIRAVLGDAILLDPESGRFDVREMMLSGDVMTKLDLAHRYLESPSRFTGAEDVGDALEEWRRSVDGLESAQPERIGFYAIGFRLGTPWIPETVMRGFLDDQFGNLMSASYVSSMGTWIVGGSADSDKDARWSTGAGRLTSVLLLKTVLNDQPAIIKVPDGDGGYRVDETQSAVLKARCEELKEVWRSWLDEHESARDAIEDAYNGLFNREVLPKYDGGHLTLAGASDVITLRPHQKNAIWRGLQGKNVLLDHAVGAGKTFAAVALAMEQRRLGLSQKPMLPVPNHLVGQWRDAFLTLYPGAQVLVAEKDDMSKQGRQAFLARAAYGNWDAIIVPHTTFGRIPPAPQDEVDYMETEINAFKEALSVYSNAGDKRSVKRMERKIATFEARMSKRVESLLKDDGALHMGNIGVDLLVVDEVQEFKNLPFTTNMKNVSGMGNPEGSLRATDLYIKIAGIQKRRPNGGGAVFLTGTPLSNTLAEMYIWQRYLDEKGLIRAGLLTFDAWKDTFSSVTREYGFTVTGEYKERTYLGKFENWPDLLRMLDRFKDSVTISDVREMLREAGMADMPIPKIAGGAPDIVKVEQTELQKEVIGFEVGENPDGTPKYNEGSIMYRLDHMPRRPGKGEDNILSLSGELTKVGLDVRALKRMDNGEGGENGSKLGAAANRILKFYHQWDEDKGTQLVFLDFSTPSNAGGKMSVSDQRVLDAMVLVREYEEKSSVGVDVSDDARAAHDEAMELLEKYSPSELESILDAGQSSGWSAYVELRGLLIEAGIPPHEIAFIHDYDGEKKDDLFGKVRSGVVRVLMGSSPKMGAGVNVQDRLVAAHHLDAPYRPLDLEQRNGRILRQGNKLLEKYGDDFAVGIHYYVTEGSGDPGRWQILEFKKRFIDQTRMPLNAVKGLRQLEDPASMALDPARVKAEASGSQVLMDRVEVADIVKKMEQTVRARVASMSEAKRAVERYAASVRWVEKGLSVLTQAAPLAAAFVEGLSVAESAAMDAERQRKDALKEARKEQRKLSKLDGNPVRTESDEDDEEASSSGFITVDAWNPLTGVVERMEHLTWKEVGILAEKSAVAMLQEASVSFSSKKIEISAHRAQDIVGRNLFTLRNVDGSEFGVVRVKSVKDRWYGCLVETGAFLSSPDAGYMEIIDDLKHFEFTPEDAFNVWADLEADRKSGTLDLSRLAASRSSSFTRTGKTIIGWPSRVGGKKDAYASELVSVSAKLSAARKEVERQSASTDQSSETVLRSAKETLAILESALKCGVRKYEAVDDRLNALSEGLREERERTRKSRDAVAAASGSGETPEVPEKASSVLEWKRDLLLSVRDDLLCWSERRESSLESLRSGRLPAEDEGDDRVRYAGAEDQPPTLEDGATTGSLPAGLPIRGAGPSDFPARP